MQRSPMLAPVSACRTAMTMNGPLPAGVVGFAVGADFEIAAKIERRHRDRRINRAAHPFGNAIGAQAAALGSLDIAFDAGQTDGDQFARRAETPRNCGANTSFSMSSPDSRLSPRSSSVVEP